MNHHHHDMDILGTGMTIHDTSKVLNDLNEYYAITMTAGILGQEDLSSSTR